MSEQTYTAEQARIALDELDDCARMGMSVAAIGPHRILAAFINQAAQMMREREPSIDASTHAFWDKQRDRQLSDAMSTDGLAGRSVDRNKREPVKVTDDDVHEAIEAYVTSDKWVACPDFEAMRAAIESFASRISTGEEFPIHQIQKGDGCWEDITPERYAAIHAGDVGRDQDLPCETRVLYAAPEVTK